MKKTDFRELGLPLCLPRPVFINSGKIAAEMIARPIITTKKLREEFIEITKSETQEFPLSTRIFKFDLQESDQVIVREAESRLPLIVYRDKQIIVNFDISTIHSFYVVDSKRPIYTYIPGFNIQIIPEGMRRSISNFVASLNSPKNKDLIGRYRRLPLTPFEFVILLLKKFLEMDHKSETQIFQWPSGKRSAFISLHDVDSVRFLRLREQNPLFRLEQKHHIKSVWNIPTKYLKRNREAIDFLIQSGNEVGWHGFNHDHRLSFQPYTKKRIQELDNSFLSKPENFPLGMRTPKNIISNHLFERLEASCVPLCYDSSLSQGIVPYYLWVNRKQSKILEIPITVPSDIAVYNQLRGVSRSRRSEIILKAQIARTNMLVEVGGIISIVTHPEKHLSERPDFLKLYDQYLSYIKGIQGIWFATPGEIYKYWTRFNSC